MSKRKLHSESTRQDLERAFLSLYAERDIEKITIKSITDGAGVYRSTFYLYYQDVYDLLNKIETEQLTTFRDYVHSQLDTDSINDWLHNIIEYFKEHGAVLDLLMRKSRGYAFKRKTNQVIQETIRNITGIKAGNQKLDLAFDYITETFIFFIEYCQRTDTDIETLYPEIMDMLHHGVTDVLTPYITHNYQVLKQL